MSEAGGVVRELPGAGLVAAEPGLIAALHALVDDGGP